MRAEGPAVGKVTERGRRLYEAKRRSEGRKAEKLGVSLETDHLVSRALDES